ncbi:ABC transporter ATP-binding protein [Reyranella sp.]|uniref:ABC transporter ATP-binding protein n=1 Tax=Reyranella sp. TaxID=1929291 RepID=UPI003BAA952D
MPRTILGYALRCTGRHQAGLALLSIAVFLLSAVPLELQRRIVNAIVEHGALETIVWLAAAYAGVAVAEQSLKLVLNVYRGWVAEDSVRSLRTTAGEAAASAGDSTAADAGVEIAVMLEEVEPIGGFTGISVSEPLLQAGILVSVLSYMLFLDAGLALLALAFFVPQMLFVPLLQGAINRRAQSRILTKRGLSGDIVNAALTSNHDGGWAREPIARVFALNMGIYKLKFTMNLLMNLMHHSAVAVALGVGGWLALEGRIEVGTVVAMVSGMGKLNDPWGDLVNWGREFSVVDVKYRLFVEALERLSGRPAGRPSAPAA